MTAHNSIDTGAEPAGLLENAVPTATAQSQATVEDLQNDTAPSWTQRIIHAFSHPKAPIYFIVAVAVGMAGFVGAKYLPALGGGANVVVFDPVRFVNAQRAAASILATRPNADLTLTMTQVAKQAEAVITEEANGSVVLVRQAVVVPDGLRDITDDVLKRFGLPTNVPTINASASSMTLDNLAPTESAFGSGALNEDYRMELEGRSRDAAIEQEKKTGQAALIP
jgi:hypothetical protein